MTDTLAPLDFSFPPPLPHTSSPQDALSPSADNAQPHHSLPSDFHFDGSGLANSPEHPDLNASWTSVDSGFGHNFATQMTLGSHGQTSPAGQASSFDNGLTTLTSTFTDHGFPQNSHIDSHFLSHTSSSSSLASLASSHHSNGLLVQSLPTETSYQVPNQHSCHSSYSSMAAFDDNKGFSAPMPVMNMSMYSMPILAESQGIPTDQLFTTSALRQQPRLAVQTDSLGKVMTRERSATRSMPYYRNRSESVSIKSEGGDDIGALLSSSTTQSTYQAPWSTAPGNTVAGGLNQLSLHHRRTSSNTSYSLNSPMTRPMLSRARRSSSFILSKKSSQELNSCEVKLQGSAAEREETVRRDLTGKADELKAMASNSQQDKARAMWVRRWLQLSYTQAPNSTVPRQGLYHSYTLSCAEYDIKPINSASFGKAVRSAYPGIQTRRLGVRGNSKYHYVCIRPAIRIEAERLNEYGDSSGAWHVAPEDGSMGFHASAGLDVDMDGEDDEDDYEEEEDSYSTLKKSPSSFDFRASQQRAALSRDRSTSIQDTISPRQKMLRRHTTVAVSTMSSQPMATICDPVFTLPGFPNIATVKAQIESQLPLDSVDAFWSSFSAHQEILAGCVRGLQFDRYEMNCRTFWAGLPPSSVHVCTHTTLSNFISDAMAVSYDHLVGTLLSKLLTPLPLGNQNALRNLAENLETIMEQAFQGFPQEFSEPKIELSVRAAHLFSRFIDLHQLTAALSPILSNQAQLRTMLLAWDNLDVRSVADQCALSCSCQQDVIESVLADFQQWLVEVEATSSRSGRAVERLGEWVDKTIKEVQSGVPGVTMRMIACRVGFITSQVMRDFTLKSDQTFGLFQLVKTWIDDWVSISALRQTALSTNSVETTHSANSSGSSMNVFIPAPGGEIGQDLSTAVPFAPGSMHALQPNLGGSQSQYLSAPSFVSDSGTPRAMFSDSSLSRIHFG